MGGGGGFAGDLGTSTVGKWLYQAPRPSKRGERPKRGWGVTTGPRQFHRPREEKFRGGGRGTASVQIAPEEVLKDNVQLHQGREGGTFQTPNSSRKRNVRSNEEKHSTFPATDVSRQEGGRKKKKKDPQWDNHSHPLRKLGKKGDDRQGVEDTASSGRRPSFYRKTKGI